MPGRWIILDPSFYRGHFCSSPSPRRETDLSCSVVGLHVASTTEKGFETSVKMLSAKKSSAFAETLGTTIEPTCYLFSTNDMPGC